MQITFLFLAILQVAVKYSSATRRIVPNSLDLGENLAGGEFIDSPNRKYRFIFQRGGNAVLRNRETSEAIWRSRTAASNADSFRLQDDGNLVIYSRREAIWDSKTPDMGVSRLTLTDDGLLALYAGDRPVWFQGNFTNLSTDLLLDLTATHRDVVIVFDFDDTLLDHSIHDWAPYTRRGIDELTEKGINIAICTANKNGHVVAKRLNRFDSTIFSETFLESDAYQSNSRQGISKKKWDEIEKIMDHYNVTDGKHVVFYDDLTHNIRAVVNKLGVHGVLLGPNGLTEEYFRDGLVRLVEYLSGELPHKYPIVAMQNPSRPCWLQEAAIQFGCCQAELLSCDSECNCMCPGESQPGYCVGFGAGSCC